MPRTLRSRFVAKPNPLTKFRWVLLLPIAAIWQIASHYGLLDFLENRTVDWRFRARGEISAPVKVVYVDVDSESITDLGNWPWDRAYFAEVCEALLGAGKAEAIGIDFVFSEKGQAELVDADRFAAGNARFGKFLFEHPQVIVAASYASTEDRNINGDHISRELPRVERPPAEPLPPELPGFRFGSTVSIPPNVGLIDTKDGGTRWVPLFAQADGLTFRHMALELARLHLGVPPDGAKIFPDRVELQRPDGARAATIPLTHRQDVEVNWFSRWNSPKLNLRASFVDALLHARNLRSDKPEEKNAAQRFFAQFDGAVVLIGPVDPLMQDIATTPMDPRPAPRVGIHGNLLKTIVSGLYLHRLSVVWQIVALLGLTTVVTTLAVGTKRAVGWTRPMAIFALAAYTGIAFVVFARWHWVLPLAAPLGAAFTTSFVGVVWQLAREEKQKGRIKSMFGTYVSPELVNRMVESGEDPKLGGAEVEITAYFSDIQGFSSFSEKLTPPQLVELMNEYLTACTDIITAHGGTLDKYVGDAVVAMFGAPVALPDHAYRACVASQRTQARLAELRRSWAAEGSRWPDTVSRMRTRIGLNSGAAVVGNMGSLTRFNYTMMGDSVNLAARLESGAKAYGVSSLVSEATKQACELRGNDCVFRRLDHIVVKGRSKPVAVYEIAGLKDTLPRVAFDAIGEYEAGLVAYLNQDWAKALDHFCKSAELEKTWLPDEETTPALVFIQRCEWMKLNPPGGAWDGVWVMQTK